MASKLIEQVRPFLTHLSRKRPSYFPPHARLIVGVSGGADSLALFHVLQSIYPPDQLIVAHVDHQLRPSSAHEAQFVQETAVAWHISCHIETVDVVKLAETQKLSLEEAGRLARYRCFAQLAAKQGAFTVVVAHHADDQAETVLMHLLRGSGLAGLRGMLPTAPLPEAENCWLIRPFLHTTRADIETYCQEHHLQPIHDESNEDIRFVRNRIRHQLLPTLAAYNPQIQTRLQQLAAITAADYELVDAAGREGWTAVWHTQSPNMIQLKLAEWLALPLSVRRQTLRQAVLALRPLLRDIGFQTVEQAREIIEKGYTGAQSSLPGDLTLIVGYHTITIMADASALPTDWPQLANDSLLTLPIPGQVNLAHEWRLTASSVDGMSQEQVVGNEDVWTVYVDVGAATELRVRGRLPGERIRPLGMKGQTVKLKDLMINRKMPAYLRARWPLVVHGEEVVWVVGHHLDERVQIKTETQRIVKIQCRLAS
ncbi:MAG: tRNA lysidine(34) synthetase TilS [Ardenticatenaceae bacterium]|nr:tRNA lysidine(34) synthetase TilS [Ardenticatenaceae bacterium]